MIVTFGRAIFEYEDIVSKVKIVDDTGNECSIPIIDLMKFATFVAVKTPNSSVDPLRRN